MDKRVKENVARMIDGGAGEKEIDAYLRVEGIGVDKIKDRAFGDGAKSSAVGGVLRGLRDIPDAGAQLLTRGLEAIMPAGSAAEDWARGQRRDVEAINQNAERDYQENWRGGEMVDKFDWGRLGGNIAGTLPLAALGGGGVAGGAVVGATSGVMQPVYSGDFWDQKTKQAGIGAVAGAAFPAVAKMLRPKVRPEIAALLAENVTPTPGQIIGGAAKTTEEKIASVPFIGDVIKSGQGRAVRDFNRAVANRTLAPIGEKVPDGVWGRELIDFVHSKASKAYSKALDPIKTIRPDDAFASKIKELDDMVRELPAAQAEQFQALLKNRVLGRFKSGAMDGRTMKDVDSYLGERARHYMATTDPIMRDYGAAIGEVQGALRELVGRAAPPQQVMQIKAANNTWARWKRLEKAAGSVAAENGVFTPKQYRSAVKGAQKGSSFARGKALDQKFAEGAVDVLANEVPDSGTTGRALAAYLLGGGAMNLEPISATAGLLGAGMYTPAGQKMMAGVLTKRPQALLNAGKGLEAISPALSAAAPQGLLRY